MKKFIKSSVAVFLVLTALLMNGCDIFESFQFGLPIDFEIESQGANDTFGSEYVCLTDDPTYLDYQEDINSINYVEAYIVTLDVSPSTISGDVSVRLYENDQFGNLLFEHVVNNLTPADHDSTNAYKLELTSEQIAAINSSLANNNSPCFYGEYAVQNITGGGATNYIRVRIDVLFNIDANLN